MSRSGQNNFTGISAQADITLLYLLQACKKDDFQQIIIEGEKWEDFTLIFTDHNEDFEVKWHNKPVSYYIIKNIIEKELKKQYVENDKLNIIVKNISKKFLTDYKYLKNNYWWIIAKNGDYKEDSVIKKFLEKGWTIAAIEFLLKTEIFEFKSNEYVNERILEYFALDDPFYLSSQDQENIVALSFRNILNKGARGGFITHQEFLDILGNFKRLIVEKSESFYPEISIRNKIINLNSYLKSEGKFKKLNNPKYLSPISLNSRLVFYIANKLEKSEFNVNNFEFFITKIMMKRRYVSLTMQLLKTKWKQEKLDTEYLLNFLIGNYKNLFFDFNYDVALQLIIEIAKKDIQGKFDDKILKFFKEEKIILPFKKERLIRDEGQKRGWREEEQVACLLKLFYRRTKNKKVIIDFIFNYFDFTTDDFTNVFNTHPKIYDIVKNYIAENYTLNSKYIVKKVSNQFDEIYNKQFRGYEWIGGGFCQIGGDYSITDKGVVRLLFKPLFEDLYMKNKEKSWSFFKKEILNKAKKIPTIQNPIFLKRALISILLDRIVDEELSPSQKKEAFKYLLNILYMKKGIPDTSKIIFDELRRQDLKKIGYENIMEMVKVDSIKFKRKDYPGGYPTNIFVISILCNLIKANYYPAKIYFLDLIKKPNFPEVDQRYNSFELLSEYTISETDPEFIVKILMTLNLENYLSKIKLGMARDTSRILTDLIKKDWDDNTNRGKQIVDALLKKKSPNKVVLDFIGGTIYELAKQDSLKTYKLIEKYLKNGKIYREKFSNSPHVRQRIVWLAEELTKNKHYNEAKHIIELCLEDIDPETTNKLKDFNYHLQVKEGEDLNIITTVRGSIPWVLQKFVISNEPKLMKFALEKTDLLLDLDGHLAKKLGYIEPDYYVRLQALFPLIELSNLKRREILNNMEEGLGDKIKLLSFKIIDIIENDIKKSNIDPKVILKQLVNIFSNIRDLNTNEAKRMIKFFEKHQIIDASFLYIYFAEFREEQYKYIPFRASFFKKKLNTMCLTNNVFRDRMAWEFWRMTKIKKKEDKRNFNKIERYWKLLFNIYEKEVFDDLYRTIAVTLNWPDKYDSHKLLVKKAILEETQFHKKSRQPTQLWELRTEIFQILKDHDKGDFLEIFYLLLENIDENIYYIWIDEWITIFNSISSFPTKYEDIYKKIESKLLELYPETFKI